MGLFWPRLRKKYKFFKEIYGFIYFILIILGFVNENFYLNRNRRVSRPRRIFNAGHRLKLSLCLYKVSYNFFLFLMFNNKLIVNYITFIVTVFIKKKKGIVYYKIVFIGDIYNDTHKACPKFHNKFTGVFRSYYR